jgi:guanine deaminase
MNTSNFVLRGSVCYSTGIESILVMEDGFLVCEDGVSKGCFPRLPGEYKNFPIVDYSGKLVVPGLTDLHMHAPQYGSRALAMDMELLEWLNTHTFPEEAKYGDLEYAERAYSILVKDLKEGPNTRMLLFATVHVPAAMLLAGMMEESGLVSLVGKVNMDRNSPGCLCEKSAGASLAATREWLKLSFGKGWKNTAPILTPRFIPSCSDDLMKGLSVIQKEFGLPLHSHLSENRKECAWVRELCPGTSGYGNAYERYDLAGGSVPTVMAHCVWSDDDEIKMLAERGVYAAHCPQSNTNLSSGIAPVRRFLDSGVRVGLGSDVAGGAHTSIFRAMTDAIQVSKLRQALIAPDEKALTLEEAFYLGTAGGGSFFAERGAAAREGGQKGPGPAGSFESGFDFDALVIDDSRLASPSPLSVRDRLERAVYLSDNRNIIAKYVRGNLIHSLPQEQTRTKPPQKAPGR